ncbi:dehydration-responsive element-binding-like protein [Medicago truncatula]|uniref:Dehydration-responsive element-binding-like protein n=1 Tax=Medicago truncatula TaxID=3880 RepID=A0A072UL91_MEDTR|nr:dehydration-responsive element-binding-like protein [Medicago truncatula]
MSLPNSGGSHWMSICNEEMRLAATTPKKRAGRKKFKETRHPVYRGVRKRNLDKWVCEMRKPNKKTKIWLGTFPTAEMATHSAWRLPKPATTQAKDIQKAAAEAAKAFRPDKTLLTNHNDNDNDNDKENDMAVVATATEEQSMICMEEKEEGVMNMQEMWSNMALMSPTHSLGYYEYQYINEDFQDEKVSLWSF